MIDGTLKLHNKETGQWEATNKSIAIPDIDSIISGYLNNYYNITQVNEKVAPLATRIYVDDAIAAVSGGSVDLTDYYNIEAIDAKFDTVNLNISNMQTTLDSLGSFNVSKYYTKEDTHTLGNILIASEDAKDNRTAYTSLFVDNTFVRQSSLIISIKHNDLTQPGTQTTFYTSADADSLFIKSGEVVSIEDYNSLVNSLEQRITSIAIPIIDVKLQNATNSIETTLNSHNNRIQMLEDAVYNSAVETYTKDEIKELFYGRTTNGDNMKF